MPKGNRRQIAALSTAAEPADGSAPVPDSQFVEALARGLRLLQCFRTGDDRGLSNKDMAARSGLSAPTVSRLCHTLQKLSYLVYDRDTGRYSMGPAILRLSYVMLRNIDVRQIARPLLRDFAEKTGITVAINLRDRLRMVILEGVSGTSPVALRLDVGARVPLHVTAAGRAYLAGLMLAEASDELNQIRQDDTVAWRKNLAAIERARREIVARGFCIEQGAWQSDIHGVAAPLNLRSAGGQYSLSCGGHAQEMPVKRMERELGPMLLKVADDIAARLPH